MPQTDSKTVARILGIGRATKHNAKISVLDDDMLSKIVDFYSNKSSSEYDINKAPTNDVKVIKKIKKLLESDNPVPIIEKIKSDSYIDKILESMNYYSRYFTDKKKEREKKIVYELTQRLSKIKQDKIAKDLEELEELKTKVEILEQNLIILEQNLIILRADKPLKRKWIKNIEKTRAINTILNNPLDVRFLEVLIHEIKNHIIEQESIIKELT
jgi:hypothetical protein